MTTKSLGNPYDGAVDLVHKSGCTCRSCHAGPVAASMPETADALASHEEVMERVIEGAIVRSVFGQNEISRRSFASMLGASTLAAALASVLPIDKVKAAILEDIGPPEKPDLRVGFIPITCATPVIMGDPMGFYARYGLNVEVVRTANWALIRDLSLSGEYDAAQMLTPMPLGITLGLGSTASPFYAAAIQNINGQAIVLRNDHVDKNEDVSSWRGMTFAVPFEYSMHNFLLRYYVAEAGLDPDQDIQIRVLPPAEMVANLSAGNIDGFLSPDPFNQRAVWENVGFIHKLTRDLWDGHPCCAFTCSERLITDLPNTYGNLVKSIVDATLYASDEANRVEISAAIAPANYLNQPVEVIEQVLTGRFADGLGNVQNVPNRIDFDPFPWQSMGVWILTQMKRWGYIPQEIDYHAVAAQVYRAADTAVIMRDLGMTPPDDTYRSHVIMGKTFDPAEPQAYVESFEIRRG